MQVQINSTTKLPAMAFACHLVGLLVGLAGVAQAAPSSLPPPPTSFSTPAGTPLRLYDNVVGYQSKPMVGGLTDRGFNRVLTWNGANFTRSSWLVSNVPPKELLQDGSSQQADINTQVGVLCAQFINPAYATLFILDVEWPLYVESGSGPFAYSLIAQNMTNFATLLRWVRTAFKNGPCAGIVRLGAYGINPANWTVFYTGAPNASSAGSWRSLVQSITKQLAPYLDVLAPSLYAPYSAYEEGVPGYGLNHVTGWTNGAKEILSEAHAAATAYSLALIPFLGLRYYLDNVPGSPYQNRYVEASFFRAMLSLVTSRAYDCEGAVFWDWGGFGGPEYANDGTSIWSNSYPWLTTTFEFVANDCARKSLKKRNPSCALDPLGRP